MKTVGPGGMGATQGGHPGGVGCTKAQRGGRRGAGVQAWGCPSSSGLALLPEALISSQAVSSKHSLSESWVLGDFFPRRGHLSGCSEGACPGSL